MGALIGFAIGYVLGTRAGRDGLERLTAATSEVLASQEFRDLLATGTAVAGGVLTEVLRRQGPLVGQLAQAVTGGQTGGLRAVTDNVA